MKRLLQKLMTWWICGYDFKYQGYIDYPGVGLIHDVQVWNLVRDHSRLIDRLNSKKMTEMSLLGQCILMGIFDEVDPNDPSWMFYGKNSLKDRKEWG